MKLRHILAILAAMGSSAALANPVTDCPMRDVAFSIDSPLLDIMLSELAKAEVEKVIPGMLKNMPPIFSGTKPPVFSAILSLKTMSHFGASDPEKLAKLDATLKLLPISAADKVARCARYDNDVPKVTKAKRGQLRVLLFEKINGFKDVPSVDAARAMVNDMAARKGWAVTTTEMGGAFNPVTLKKFDVVIWNNISGDVLSLSQRRAFKGWMEKGGGFVGLHGTAGDPTYFWDWYVDTLLGARFIGHPNDPQFQDATVRMEKSPSGIGANLPTVFTMKDEWYSFAKSARLNGAHVIATLDETTYKQTSRFGGNLTMGADHPIVWTRCVGNGRMFYSAIGHRPEMYSLGDNVSLVEQAITWADGKGASKCKSGQEVAVQTN
jgi:uncharacterized protein